MEKTIIRVSRHHLKTDHFPPGEECPALLPEVVGDEGGGGISAGGVPSTTAGAIPLDEQEKRPERRGKAGHR